MYEKHEQQQKLENALILIEEAQRTILSASQELSAVDGMAREWVANNKLYDRVKAQWHRVESRRQQLEAKAQRRRVA